MTQNKQILLRKRPFGTPKEDTWELVKTDIPQLKDGEFLVKCEYISLDPAMRMVRRPKIIYSSSRN